MTMINLGLKSLIPRKHELLTQMNVELLVQCRIRPTLAQRLVFTGNAHHSKCMRLFVLTPIMTNDAFDQITM